MNRPNWKPGDILSLNWELLQYGACGLRPGSRFEVEFKSFNPAIPGQFEGVVVYTDKGGSFEVGHTSVHWNSEFYTKKYADSACSVDEGEET